MSAWAKRNEASRFSNPPPSTVHAGGAPFRSFDQETRENRRNSRFSLEWSVRNLAIIFSASRTNERSHLGSS
jgi:hypothetical protein